MAAGYTWAFAVLAACWLFVGENAWPVALSLYLPLGLFLCMLVAAIVVLLIYRRTAIVLLGLASLAVTVGPVMGLTLNLSESEVHSGPHLRIYSHNVRGVPDLDALVAAITEVAPDIVLLQEAGAIETEVWDKRFPTLQWIKRGQFVIGSKFSVARTDVVWRRWYVRYDVSLPTGTLTCFNIHPFSIGSAIGYAFGLEVPNPPPRWQHMSWHGIWRDDIRRRLDALQGIAEDARNVQGPVVVAGDSNVPGGGPFLRNAFAGLTDVFHEVGAGWGHTFPAWLPWMRLDRIWVGGGVRPAHVSVEGAAGSDHLAVVADILL